MATKTRTTNMRLTEPQVRTLLAAVRNKISDYEGDLDDARSSNVDETIEWYEDRLAELRPLEQRLNDAGLRLTRGA